MFNKFFLVVFLFFISGCASCGEPALSLSSYLFSPKSGVEKFYFLGGVKYIDASEFEAYLCPKGEVCLHPEVWHVYDLTGSMLPKIDNEDETITVVHKYGSALYHELPWLATLEKIDDEELKEQTGAEYILVGVDLGVKIFCPNEKDKKLFEKMKPDFKDLKYVGDCYSL